MAGLITGETLGPNCWNWVLISDIVGMHDFDYDSNDENSHVLPSMDNEVEDLQSRELLPMNSTLAPRVASEASPGRAALMVRLGNIESALNRGNLINTNELGNQISTGIGAGLGAVIRQTMSASDKRSRSPSEAPETPVVVCIKLEGSDDNHKVFCWELRRLYKNPNCDPKTYWSEAKYPVKVVPNLRGNVYLTHLMPLSVSAKALGWLHNQRNPLSIKYFIHSNRSGKRAKKEGVTIASGMDDLGTTNYSVEEHWESASNIKETLDGLWNLTAAMFQIRPWDWTPLVIGRILHECGFFVGCSNNKDQQKMIVTEFIDECLYSTQSKLGQETPPITYKDGLAIAQEVVNNANGRTYEVFRRKCIYSSRFDLQAKDAEIADLKKQLANARSELVSLKNAKSRNQGGGYSGGNGSRGTPPNTARGRGRGGRGGGPGRYTPGSDPEFEAKRLKVCRRFNIGSCTDGGNCTLLHQCNKRVAVGHICGNEHPSKDHI